MNSALLLESALSGLAFFLSRLAGKVILLADLKTQIPNCQFPTDMVCRGICLLYWMPVLLAVCNSIGAQQPAARSSPTATSPVTAVVNKYCVTCHDSEVKKGGLDL